MKRFISGTLAFLLFSLTVGPFLGCKEVAAQELQQSQSSGTTQSTTVKPPAAPVPDVVQSVPAKSAATTTPETLQLAEPVANTPPAALRIPDGTPIEVEAPYTFRSMDFKPQDRISFRVVNPIKINGVTVVEQGANATGRVDRSKRGGHWGKAGLLVWTMLSVTAVDGSQIPVRPTSVRLRGDSKGAKVATQMIVMGALMPFIAPVALLAGFKRGKDAFIPEGKRYSVFVDGDASIKSSPGGGSK